MKKTVLLAAAALVMSSCKRVREKFSRDYSSSRDYEIIMFSGGDTVFKDKFHGMINNSENSDGIYYFKNDTLVEVSGDYVIHSN